MIMKKLSFTCLGILLSVCTSCSNSDEEEKDWTGQPSVTISDPVGEKDIQGAQGRHGPGPPGRGGRGGHLIEAI